MDVTGYKPMKHIKMMNLTEIKRVVDIVDEEATGRFALVCRSNEVSVQTSFQNSRSRFKKRYTSDQKFWQHSSKEIPARMLPTLLIRLGLVTIKLLSQHFPMTNVNWRFSKGKVRSRMSGKRMAR